MSRLKVIALILIALLLLLAWTVPGRFHALRALPDATGGWFVTYARNVTHGLGPGGNETGFNVVLLTASGAGRVAEGGVRWLNAQPGGRVIPNWEPTPVPQNDYWMGSADSAAGRHDTPTVRAVLERYGFGLDLPASHEATVDAALNTPGSFYAFGRGGLVVVIVPETRRAYVLYAG